MRRRVVLLILVLAAGGPFALLHLGLAGAVSYASDIPAGRLIAPGVRIGPWTVAADIAGLIRALGRPLSAPPPAMFDQQPGLSGYVWAVPEGRLTAWSPDRKTVGYLEFRGSRNYQTAKLIRVGSTNADVQAAYGVPSGRSAIPGASRYIYDALGLAVFTQGTSVGFIVVGINVFRPGTAKNFWKF